jgi:hypothetical protein
MSYVSTLIVLLIICIFNVFFFFVENSMPLKYIKFTVPKKAQIDPPEFNNIISWATEEEHLTSIGVSYDSEHEFNVFLNELEEIENFSSLYQRIALVCDREKSGYVLAYGFIAFPKNSQPQYFQYEKPVRFEDNAMGSFHCINFIKNGEVVKGKYVDKINTVASAKDYEEQFFSLHREFLQRDKGSFFGLRGFFNLYRTLIKPHMSLQEIVHHAEQESNRSREVLVHMGLMTKDGKKSEALDRCLELYTEKQELK